MDSHKRKLFLLYIFHVIVATKSYSKMQQPLCRDDEQAALLQFKQSFVIDETASQDPSAYPKILSWNLERERSDCCLWDGIKCDDNNGHVIGLDLSSSFLYGSVNSSSSLFSLVHLRSLNLADNHFNYSYIPSGIFYFSSLSTLNLSSSVFSGQIPSEILRLSKLVSLDLSHNVDYESSENLLKLETIGLKLLTQNLPNLKELSLSMVNISSTIPGIMANLTSLTALHLRKCKLYGDFPRGIFLLPNLQFLDLGNNHNLTGYLPEFSKRSPGLKELRLNNANFSGKLPNSIGNLNSLNVLDVYRCSFSGSLPASLGNLTQLAYLDLGDNTFTEQVPPLTSLSKLTYLSLSGNNFSGKIPFSLANLTKLMYIDFSRNNLSGEIPSWLTNLTQLTHIDLSSNPMQGPIPRSFSKLKNLEFLNLYSANLSNTVEADIFLNLKKLTHLQLSHNVISFLGNNNTNATLPQFKFLGLSSCNTREFPSFLRFQDELEHLFLDDNHIEGLIPEWVWNRSEETLDSIWLSYNFLTGFEHHPVVLPWARLRVLDINFNMLQGSLPVPPPTTLSYSASYNELTGEIVPLLCHVGSLCLLDLSKNSLSGSIPPCLGNFSNSLIVLNLRGNNFRGTIPQIYAKGLRMVDLSENQLEGQLPRSLADCTMLQLLNLGDNQIEDSFPLWLATLSELQVLILRTNKFRDAIKSRANNLEFPKLRIIDLSNNDFTGNLPLGYLQSCKPMIIWSVQTYMQADIIISVGGWTVIYEHSMTMTNKGVKLLYEKISNKFTAIDFSSNKFSGRIPESIGVLKGIQLLNFSNNVLSGGIPQSMGNLTELESLDLSQNKLSGEIPHQLTQLSFLAIFNVSFNNLTGPIPMGKQFDTFQNNSYDGNFALCGHPLSKKCRNSEKPTPSPPVSFEEEGDDSEFLSFIDWIFIIMGYGSGLIVGRIFWNTLTRRVQKWFIHDAGTRGDEGIEFTIVEL